MYFLQFQMIHGNFIENLTKKIPTNLKENSFKKKKKNWTIFIYSLWGSIYVNGLDLYLSLFYFRSIKIELFEFY
jgi:hypothetical protein